MYLGFILNQESREKILDKFPIQNGYKEVLHHVTLFYNPKDPNYWIDDYFSYQPKVEVVGIVQDDNGCALVCMVNNTIFRPNGFDGIFHITHSLKPGIAPVYSNTLINEKGFTLSPWLQVSGKVEVVN